MYKGQVKLYALHTQKPRNSNNPVGRKPQKRKKKFMNSSKPNDI